MNYWLRNRRRMEREIRTNDAGYRTPVEGAPCGPQNWANDFVTHRQSRQSGNTHRPQASRRQECSSEVTMGINLVVAVTDDDWFEMLRKRPNLSEVNFWAPSAATFRALQPGEMFLFKLHAPRNVIVGGGIFAYANALPCSLAWAAFGEANGARSAQEMRTRIARYRRTDPNDRSDFAIGCRILTQPFFFEEADWIPVPPSWSPNIVSFKTYNTGDAEGMALWEAVNDRLNRLHVPVIAEAACSIWRAATYSPTPWTRCVPRAGDGYLPSALRGYTGANAAGSRGCAYSAVRRGWRTRATERAPAAARHPQPVRCRLCDGNAQPPFRGQPAH